MKIRSITYFCNPGWPLEEKKLQQAGSFLAEARSAFEAEGFEVQTTRLATTPFPRLLGPEEIPETPQLAGALSRLLAEVGVSYASLGPALPELPSSYAIIPEALAASKNVFFSGIMADDKHGINLRAVHACADAIIRIASLEPNGFANLNFAALANVQAGAPFFPAAYHEGKEPAFSLAMECADAAVEAFQSAHSVEEGRQNLVTTLEKSALALNRVADFLKFKYLIRFGGIDFSLAPFPEESRSVGAAMESMGVARVGLHGSLAAAAILTEAVQRANVMRTGFSGFFNPVLEDSVLARRANEGTLTIKDLLLYSAVCGTGLDTVPLAGDVTSNQVSALLLDLCVLSARLAKPLTARLMPIPGKKAGDPTQFDFGFFANSRVMLLEAESLGGILGARDSFHLNKYSH